MTWIAPGWELAWERSPDWLFVRIRCPKPDGADAPPLAEQIWSIVHHESVQRVVLDVAELPMLFSYVIGQMMLLQKRLCAQSGVIRLCCVSPRNFESIRLCRLDHHLPCFANREDAVLGRNPLHG